MSNTEVATMATVQERVQQRIREAFVDLVPDELWKSLVDAEIKRITKDDVPKLVKQEVERVVRKMVADTISGVDWQHRWDAARAEHMPATAIRAAIQQAAPDLVQAMFSQVTMHAVNAIRSSLR